MARKAARTRGSAGRSAAAKKAAKTRGASPAVTRQADVSTGFREITMVGNKNHDTTFWVERGGHFRLADLV